VKTIPKFQWIGVIVVLVLESYGMTLLLARKQMLRYLRAYSADQISADSGYEYLKRGEWVNRHLALSDWAI
jgi:hypothetical protein